MVLAAIRVILTAAIGLTVLSTLTEAASITLKWIAPGDDNHTGKALFYDVRYSTSPITEENWETCAPVFGIEPWPKTAGSLEQMQINYLEDRTLYYFAIKAVDEAGNWSPLSRLATYATCEAGCIGVRGNMTADPEEQIDISDLVFLVEFLFGIGPPPPCFDEANINGDSASVIDVADLLFLVEFLFNSQAPPPPVCP